ncbi:MAG: WYL domain-containing protein [Phycisphaera sp.]|nr:WYL domain-containing protein [Phycisphaera sp.]
MRGKRLNRLIQVISLLRGPGSWNARNLAEHFGTSRRNIYRDLAVLELAGVPYFFDPDFGEGGGYRIRPEWFFPPVGLTDQECLDLAVMTRVAEGRCIPLLDQVCEVRDKLLGTLPPKQQDLIRAAGELFEILNVGMAEHGHARKVMIVLQNALLTRRQINGTYYSPHEKRTVEVNLQPCRVFLCGQAWYLAAHDVEDDKTKLYRVARFKKIELTDQPIDIEPEFSLREMLGNAWTVYRGERDYHVEIEFDPEIAELVAETSWHHTQRLEWRDDGALIFRSTVSGLDEIKNWMMQWGPHARVLKPKELAQEIRGLAEAIVGVYAMDGTQRESMSLSD